MTILIVEDQEIMRIGLGLIIDQMLGVKVVGAVADGQSAVEEALHLKPHVVLMDVALPVLDGIEATRRIKAESPTTRIIILSVYDTDAVLFAALSAGADGYCLKELSKDQLEIAIKSVAGGAAWLDPKVANRVLSSVPKSTAAPVPDIIQVIHPESPLSQREADVLRLVIDGASNQEIADKLGLSIETIKTHMRHIMEKLAVADRTQAAVKAMRLGLV